MSPATMQSRLRSDLEDGAVRAAVAQGRGLAGRRGHFRRGLAGQDAPHALHVQFAEAVHLRLSLHGDARRAKLLDQVGIALFDDHAAVDAADEAGDLLQRQRIGQPQFQHAGRRGRLADVHERHAGGDDAQIRGRPRRPIQIAVFVPARRFPPASCASDDGPAGHSPGSSRGRDVALELRRQRLGRRPTGANHRLAVADARGHPQQDRQLPAGRKARRPPA